MSLLNDIIRSQEYKSASLLPSQIVEIEKLSDSAIMKIFSRMLPTDIINIGPFYIYYLLRDVDRELWNSMLEYIKIFYNQTCRGEIAELYQTKFKEANLMVLCVSHDKDIYDEYKIDVLNGFLIARYDIPRKEANIILICFQNLSLDKLQSEDKRLRLSGGLFLHCLGLNILRQLKIKNVYLEASVKELITYYYRLGYRLGKEYCGQDDKITDLHQFYPIEKVINKLPRDYADETYDFSYRMKFCDFDEKSICFEAFQKFRENISLISSEMLTSRIKSKKEMYLGPSDNPKKYKIIKMISDQSNSKEYYALDDNNIVRIYLWNINKFNIQKLKDRLRCIRKVRKLCDQISCYIEHFEIDDHVVVVTSWMDGYVSLEDYLSQRLQLVDVDENTITNNIYKLLDELYSNQIYPNLSDKNTKEIIKISPETLDIYITSMICEEDPNHTKEKNSEFVDELYDSIFTSNRENDLMNKEIVKKTKELIKILKRIEDRDETQQFEEKIRSFGEELNQTNFKINNMIVNVYIHSDDLLKNIERLSNIALSERILSLSRKKKWLKLLRTYVDKWSMSSSKKT